MNRLIFILLLLICVGHEAGAKRQRQREKQRDSLMYRIRLTDKAATTYSLDHPEQFLSDKALARRSRQHLAVDSTDLPVCRSYVQAIEQCGVRVVAMGKWENFVTVSCSDSTRIAAIAALPFVRHTEKVWTAPAPSLPTMNFRRDSIMDSKSEKQETAYGVAWEQIAKCKGEKLHEAGFRGQGMTVAVIDAGFHNVDRIAAFSHTRIAGHKDFVHSTSDIFAESNHGTGVLSCIGMNSSGLMIGTAPEADFWLLRSEDEYSEHLVEQDYWAAAVEFADSVGVDVINTSLGYYSFDDATKNYDYRHLDGSFSLMSRQASRLAGKGIVLVCSAGNSGMTSWKKITPPADAFDVLTVGAIRKTGVLAPFSSVGNTADGRVKPDVVAVGEATDIMNPYGFTGKANGTSFASPIVCGLVTCLWQALPQLTAKEVIELVRRTASRAACPDNIYGYGVPDVWKAYEEAGDKR